MATVIKYLVQFLILPAIKAAFDYLVRRAKTISDFKKIDEAAKEKVDAFKNAPAKDANDNFGPLP